MKTRCTARIPASIISPKTWQCSKVIKHWIDKSRLIYNKHTVALRISRPKSRSMRHRDKRPSTRSLPCSEFTPIRSSTGSSRPSTRCPPFFPDPPPGRNGPKKNSGHVSIRRSANSRSMMRSAHSWIRLSSDQSGTSVRAFRACRSIWYYEHRGRWIPRARNSCTSSTSNTCAFRSMAIVMPREKPVRGREGNLPTQRLLGGACSGGIVRIPPSLAF